MSIYNELCVIAEKNPNKIILNDWTYSELLSKINDQPYCDTIEDTDISILLKIFKAAKLNKPTIVLPKFNRDKINIPTNLPNEFILVLYSSGSSGNIRNPIMIPNRMLSANAKTKFNKLSPDDIVAMSFSLNHTGGINVYTLSGLLSGTRIIIDPFDPYRYFKNTVNYNCTVGHLIPRYVDILSKMYNHFETPLTKMTIGSDCVYKHHVDFFLNKNIQVVTLYGMTESGPPVIAHTWNQGDDLSIYDMFPANECVPLGTEIMCDYKIIDGELFLKGNIIASDDWFATGDCVSLVNGWFMYHGRKIHGGKIIPKSYN
jgi:acyl-CoA synthetase (AMP-forming)/AMP-acid ligase II